MKNDIRLPENIKVNISREEGCFFAELPDYDCFTEADSIDELFTMVNDLIYEVFDVPRKIQTQIRYLPQRKPEKSKFLTVMTTPDIFRRSVDFHVD